MLPLETDKTEPPDNPDTDVQIAVPPQIIDSVVQQVEVPYIADDSGEKIDSLENPHISVTAEQKAEPTLEVVVPCVSDEEQKTDSPPTFDADVQQVEAPCLTSDAGQKVNGFEETSCEVFQAEPADVMPKAEGIPEQAVHSERKLVLDFTLDILDKQYRSYTWNDGKVQALVTIDAAILAGVFIIIQVIKNVSVMEYLLLGAGFISLLVSLWYCLLHIIPRLNSGVGNEQNLRTMVGITHSATKENYYERIGGMTLEKAIEMNCWQIFGMCKNNVRSHRLIKKAVVCTGIGVLLLAASLPVLLYSNQANASQNQPNPKNEPTKGAALESLSPPHVKLCSESDPKKSELPPPVTKAETPAGEADKPARKKHKSPKKH